MSWHHSYRSINYEQFYARRGLLAVAIILFMAGPAQAQLQWVPHGPGPIIFGQVEGITNREVVGAIHDVAPHPNNANVLYIGSVNGGVWRTLSATATNPHWEPLTDDQESLSIGALEFDPTDATNQTLVAAFGRFSSFDALGGRRGGLLRTTNGGDTWTPIDGGGTLNNLNISGVAPRGNVIVMTDNAAVNAANRGVWRTTDGGNNWTQISGAAGSGLPAGQSFDLVGDPNNDAVLYTALLSISPGDSGIYRSTDTGATWTKISDAEVDGFLILQTNNVEFAVAQTGAVFVGIVNSGRLAAVFRSPDGDGPWALLNPPQTIESGGTFGIHVKPQGGIHFSIVADPVDDNIVYVGGDRQPGSDGDSSFPNSLGALTFSGRLFRVDASTAGGQATSLTHSGTTSNSAPHADSRDMAFDANGDLIEVDDGGVYRRTNPRDATGDWFSLNGDIATTEFHSVAWDAVSKIIVGGAQDTGTPQGIAPTDPRWFDTHLGDGGDVAVDDTGFVGDPGFADRSLRYTSSQELGGFRIQVFGSANELVFTWLLAPLLPEDLVPQFITPIELNNAAPERIVVGADDDIYESFDFGAALVAIEVEPPLPPSETFKINSKPSHPIAYGATDNPNVLYVGRLVDVWIRTDAGRLIRNDAYIGRRNIADIAIDPDNSRTAFVIDDCNVYMTDNAGADESWSDVTGNLPVVCDSGEELWSVEFIDAGGGGLGGGLINDAIAVGGNAGVFVAQGPSFNDWEPLGDGLPKAPVLRLDYSRVDKILLAGTLGRGAWTLNLSGGVPVDVMLVLDFSGSMLSPACPGCDDKLDVLKDSAEIFVQLWRAMAKPEDRIGVNYFRTNIDEFAPGGVVLQPVVSNAPEVIDDMRGRITINAARTAMGGGLQQGINRLDDAARVRNIILFTDGIQNVDPSVVRVGDRLEIAETGEFPDSDVSATSPPTRLDAALNIKVNTIGVGATPAFVELLGDIASETEGVTQITTAPDEDLRRFFVEELVDVLRDSSPQLVAYVKSSLDARGRDRQDFVVNDGSRQVTFKLSWRDGDMGVTIYKDHRDVTQSARVISGPYYRILVFDSGETFPLGGGWQVSTSGKQGEAYEVAVITDEPALDYRFSVAPARVPAGERVKLMLDLEKAGRPFEGRVRAKATIIKPSRALAKRLCDTKWRLTQRKDGSPLLEAAFDHLLANDAELVSGLRGDQVQVELAPAGAGRYVAEFDDTELAGAYTAILQFEGKDEGLGRIVRTESQSFVVRPGEISRATAGLSVTALPGPLGLVTDYTVRLKPRDRLGNCLGPERTADLSLKIEDRSARVSKWQDFGDGSYEIRVRTPKDLRPIATITVAGSTIFKNESLGD